MFPNSAESLLRERTYKGGLLLILSQSGLAALLWYFTPQPVYSPLSHCFPLPLLNWKKVSPPQTSNPYMYMLCLNFETGKCQC